MNAPQRQATRRRVQATRERYFTELWYMNVGLPSEEMARTGAFHDIDADFIEALDFLPRYAYISEIPDDGGPPTVAFSHDLAKLTGDAHYDVHGPSMHYPLCFLDLDARTCQRITVRVDFGDPA